MDCENLITSKIDTESTSALRFEFEGDGFLYNMVRILTGTLLEVGCGLRTVEETAGK